MWKNRNVWILMSGELIAGLGLWFGMIGNLEFLQQNVPSDFVKAVILMAGAFVAVLLGPAAGRVVDRASKKKILLLAGLVRVLGSLFMFPALHDNSVFWMLGYSILIGGASAFYFPALQSTIPLIVREEQLLPVNGVYMNVSTFARIIGTAAAGVLLVWMSLFSLYLYTTIAYAVLVGFTFSLRIPEQAPQPVPAKTQGVPKPKGGFKDIWPVIKGLPDVWMSLFLCFVPNFFIGGFNLMVISISELQHDPSVKGLLYTTEGVSLMIGAALTKRLSAGRNLIPVLLASAFLVALAHLSLFFAACRFMPLVSFGLFGLAAGSFFPQVATLFQKRVPKEFHGRFFSFRSMLDRVLMQVIMLGVGLFLDTIGFQAMVLVFGCASLLLVLRFSWQQRKKPLTFIDKPTKANM